MKIMKKEELRNVDGSDSLHPNRSGDVVVVTMPPYQSDAGTNGQAIALSHFFGQHGFLPNYVNLTGNINMHATFVAGGPGLQAQGPRQGAPCDRHRTDARLPDGHPRPAERARADPLRRRRGCREADGGHDPRHQRLPRSAGAARRGVGQRRVARRQRSVRDRRLGVPEDVVPDLRGRGGAVGQGRQAERDRDGCRRLGRRDAADLRVLQRRADDRSHEHDGNRHRRAREPQLRPRAGQPPPQPDPAGELPVRLVEPRGRQRQHAGRVVAVARVQVRPRRQARHRRLLERRPARADEPGGARSVPRRELDDPRERRGREDREEDGRHRGDRAPRRDCRHADRSDRPARRSRRQRARTSTR